MDQEQLAGRRGQYYASSGKGDSGIISEVVRQQPKDGDKPEDEDNSSWSVSLRSSPDVCDYGCCSRLVANFLCKLGLSLFFSSGPFPAW